MTTTAESVEPDDASGGAELLGFAELFGDTAQTRVLRFLSENPEDSYKQIAIAEEVDVSQPMVSRAVKPLKQSGIIQSTHEGIRLAEGPIRDALIEIASQTDEKW